MCIQHCEETLEANRRALSYQQFVLSIYCRSKTVHCLISLIHLSISVVLSIFLPGFITVSFTAHPLDSECQCCSSICSSHAKKAGGNTWKKVQTLIKERTLILGYLFYLPWLWSPPSGPSMPFP